MIQTEAITARHWHLTHVFLTLSEETVLILKPGKRSKNSQALCGPPPFMPHHYLGTESLTTEGTESTEKEV